MRTNSPEALAYASKEECILVFLATGEKTSLGKDVQDAFKAWQKLSPLLKWDMNIQIQETLKDGCEKELYHCLIRCFDLWDHTQDIDGAPGWRIKDSSLKEIVKHMGEDMLCLLHTMEAAWANRKKKCSKIFKPSEFRSPGFVAEVREVMKDVGNEDCVATGSMHLNSVEMDAKEFPDCLPAFSNDEKVEKFRKDHFQQDEFGNQSMVEKFKEISQDSDELQGNQNGLINSTISKLNESIDISFEEKTHLLNLRLSDRQDDSDFKKQISPMISGDEA